MGDDQPANTAEFRQRMRRLRSDCGNPTQAQMRQVIATFDVDRLARATLSEFFSDARAHSLPRWGFVRSYVAACLLHHGTPPRAVPEQLETWADWWTTLASARNRSDTGAAQEENRHVTRNPPTTADTVDLEAVVGTDQVDATQEADSPVPAQPRRRLRTIMVITVGAAVGFGAGLAVTSEWWRASPGPDPSLAYGICAEAIGPSNRVGHIALLADTGPHGTPVQDRLIELRVQKHPDRDWITWAYLARGPSHLDRLWLDWSYLEDPGDEQANFRRCGAQPVSEGRGTPGVLVTDESGRPRWFRACGQVPAEDRAPDRSGTFCTNWTRPRTS
ncbi:hypothetical protein BLA60_17960 [Actinophytocola xinjiangensis]|uniref:Uncharacterized protein n=2 Tax=Actinophytocola xinjiangensis TaxID=485602 RepID=A0A7Z0WLV2_9PSEU|nr:hypothetical protein BLA60_17960 [Actinophytocola xinjiangensis]